MARTTKAVKKIKVFIGFGSDSKDIAQELGGLLTKLLLKDHLETVTAQNIPPGDNWFSNLNNRIKDVDVGIFCLTKKNRNNLWMHYEAGIVVSTAKNARKVIPYLIDFKASDSSQSKEGDGSWYGPLTMTKGTEANPEETLELVQDLNKMMGSPLTTSFLERSFNNSWKELECKIQSLLNPAPDGTQSQTDPRIDHTNNGDQQGISSNTEFEESFARTRELLNSAEAEILGIIFKRGMEEDFDADVFTATLENILSIMKAEGFSEISIRRALEKLKTKGYVKRRELHGIRAYDLTDHGKLWVFDHTRTL